MTSRPENQGRLLRGVCIYVYFYGGFIKWGGVWSASAVRLSEMGTPLTPLLRVPFPTDLVRKGSVRSYFRYEETTMICRPNEIFNDTLYFLEM